MWWISMAVKFIFYSSIILAGLYVYRVGIQAAGRDLGWVLGLVEGFVEDFHTRANAAAAAAANPSSTGVPGWNGNGSPGGEGKWW